MSISTKVAVVVNVSLFIVISLGSYFLVVGQRQNLEEELLNKGRMAGSLTRLAAMYEDRREIDTAVRLLVVAHDLFAAIGSPGVEQARNSLENLRALMSAEHFDGLLLEARSQPNRIIREVLSKNRELSGT